MSSSFTKQKVAAQVEADEDQQVDALKAKIASSNNKDSLSSIMGAFGGKAKSSGGMMGAFGGLKKNAAVANIFCF